MRLSRHCENAPRELIQCDELSPLVFKDDWNQNEFFSSQTGSLMLEKIPRPYEKLDEDPAWLRNPDLQYGTEPVSKLLIF